MVSLHRRTAGYRPRAPRHRVGPQSRAPPCLPLGEHGARQRQEQPLGRPSRGRRPTPCPFPSAPSCGFPPAFFFKTLFTSGSPWPRPPPRRCHTASSNWLRLDGKREAGYRDHRPLAILVSDPETGEVVGGLLGGT